MPIVADALQKSEQMESSSATFDNMLSAINVEKIDLLLESGLKTIESDPSVNANYTIDVARPTEKISPLKFDSEDAEYVLEKLKIVTTNGKVNLRLPDTVFDDKYTVKSLSESILAFYTASLKDEKKAHALLVDLLTLHAKLKKEPHWKQHDMAKNIADKKILDGCILIMLFYSNLGEL